MNTTPTKQQILSLPAGYMTCGGTNEYINENVEAISSRLYVFRNFRVVGVLLRRRGR